jgi:hypothetical protein
MFFLATLAILAKVWFNYTATRQQSSTKFFEKLNKRRAQAG